LGDFQRSHRRSCFRARRDGNSAKKEKSAFIENPQITFGSKAIRSAECGRRFLPAATTGSKHYPRERSENSDQTPAQSLRVAGDVIRLARGQTCEIQRDRVRRREPHLGYRGRPNEPGGCQPNRRLESGRGWTEPKGQRGLQRCVLSFS